MPLAHTEQTSLGMSIASQDFKLLEKQGHIEPRFPKMPSERGNFLVRLIYHHITNDFSPEFPHKPPCGHSPPCPREDTETLTLWVNVRAVQGPEVAGVLYTSHTYSPFPVRVLTHSFSLFDFKISPSLPC